jgi:hypothetical protein
LYCHHCSKDDDHGISHDDLCLADGHYGCKSRPWKRDMSSARAIYVGFRDRVCYYDNLTPEWQRVKRRCHNDENNNIILLPNADHQHFESDV